MRPFLTALVLAAALAPAARAAEVRHFEDAALHAVQFLDTEEGWAVGDEGVIWHTIDGGKSWERQPTPVRASLRSVHFLNVMVGWVAGREELPQGGSAGVLLYTTDGGLKWQRVLANALPGLNQVHFLNPREGFAVGDGSDQLPTGVFQTGDGGRNWKPVPGPRCPGWRAAAFQDGQTGALVGAWGRLAKVRHGALGTADVEALGGRTLCALQMSANKAFAVGQGGAVLFSTTSGARWGYARLRLPAEVLANLDFHALFWIGNHLWAAGRPGSVLLHSPNEGETWELVKTGQRLPLHGLFFLDNQHGWAVGEAGTILATKDAGKTWTVQQQGGRRAALLCVHARSADVPADALALLGGGEGYLAAVLRVVSPDPKSAAPDRSASGERLAFAVRQAGGLAGEMLWQFPLPEYLAGASREEVLQSWHRLHGNRADRELLRQLVLALRMWRPDVVVTDPPEVKAGGPAESLVAEALQEAYKQAGDASAFPEQLKELGLEPWRVGKVYAPCLDRQGGQVVLDLTEPRPGLEMAARDFAGPAATLLAGKPVLLPARRCFRLLAATLAGAANQRGLMDGLNLAPGGPARRKLPAASELGPEVQKAVRASRAFRTLAEAPAGGLADPGRTLAEVGRLAADLPEDQAALALFAVANQYARQGQWDLARETFLLLVDRYPAHPRTAEAYRWLIRHNASSEARRRHELGQFLVVSRGRAGDKGSGSRHAVLLGSQEQTRQWYKGSLAVGERLAAFGPVYANDPATQFCLMAARRQLGDFEGPQQWYTWFAEHHADGPWHDAAAAELWLTTRAGASAKPVAYCRQTELRPFLDGRFDDPCWQGQPPLPLRDAVGRTAREYPTEVKLAYDQDFLYLSLRCRHPADKYVAPVKVRKRDADLKPYDRVSLLLDLDRDYSTYFHFQVDQRGCVYDDCWGDHSWNPRWYVAVRSDSTCWRIEAAIPLAELTGDKVPAGSAWAFNVVRVLPGRGVQAFSVPADVEPRPEGMGLLLFAREDERPAPLPRPVVRKPLPRVP